MDDPNLEKLQAAMLEKIISWQSIYGNRRKDLQRIKLNRESIHNKCNELVILLTTWFKMIHREIKKYLDIKKQEQENAGRITQYFPRILTIDHNLNTHNSNDIGDINSI